jgi:MutS-like protein
VNPLVEYNGRLAQRRAVSEREQKRFRLIGNARLATGIAGAAMAFFVFGETVIPPWFLTIPALLFWVLVVMHARVVESLERANRAVTFYERGVQRLENKWMGKGEQGERFRNPAHVYEEDLDIFGKGSLFELLCTVRTRSGEDTLAKWLLAPASTTAALERQQAIQELRGRLDLREELAVLGDALRSNADPDAIAAWAEAPRVTFFRGANMVAALLAAAVVITFGLYMARIATRTPFLAALFVELTCAFLLGTKTLHVTGAVNAPARDLGLLAKLLDRLEKETFETALLVRLRNGLADSGLVASVQIGRLRRLVSLLDWQRNILFAPIGIATLWSAQIAMLIERWRAISGKHVRGWIAGVGEFETLFALAGYCFEHPLDAFPEITEVDGGWFEAIGLGHPLMPEAQFVPNDVRLGGDLRLLIISGSNMSGKSTLLRSVGLNVVLAWAGAPVRAKRLTISPLAVGASIRVMDSLQDGRSRFYAEITRLREIVDLLNGPRTVLFLMDELLSGTNSHDRKIGAAAIVLKLIDRGAIGMITTHDLALAHIAEDLPGRAVNVHLADTLENGRLHFDFKLREGIVERSNALDLMRSVGLEV